MTDASMSREQARELAAVWWLPLSVGVLSMAAGVIVLAKPGNSLTTLAVVTGIFVLLGGIAELISSLRSGTENRGVVALLGALNAIVGVVLIRHPVGGVTFVAVVLGIWLIAIGAVRFVQAFDFTEHRVWRFVVAVTELIAGIVIISSPNIGFATLALLVGFAFIVNGVSMFVLGLAMRTIKRDLAEPPAQPVAAGT